MSIFDEIQARKSFANRHHIRFYGPNPGIELGIDFLYLSREEEKFQEGMDEALKSTLGLGYEPRRVNKLKKK